MLAVGISDGANMTREAREAMKNLREALKSDKADGTVLCASDVDQVGDDGWTPYAPLPDSTPTP
jgi:hypothetical protein